MKKLFWFGVVFTIAAPVIIGIKFDDPSTSWVAALCGAFITFISKWEEISELSLGPVKAKMKEKIEEADKVLKQLRETVTVTSHATLTDLAAGGMGGGMSLRKRLEIHKNIISNLRTIGTSEEQVAMAEKDWKKAMNIIYSMHIQHLIEERKSSSTANFEAPENRKQALKALKKFEEYKNWKEATPDEIRSVLEHYSVKDEVVDLWVNDYDHFLSRNEILRLEEFINIRDTDSV